MFLVPVNFAKQARMSALGQKPTSEHVHPVSALPPKADMVQRGRDVRFSNRPAGVKRFQAIHDRGVNVTRGLVLLYGIGT